MFQFANYPSGYSRRSRSQRIKIKLAAVEQNRVRFKSGLQLFETKKRIENRIKAEIEKRRKELYRMDQAANTIQGFVKSRKIRIIAETGSILILKRRVKECIRESIETINHLNLSKGWVLMKSVVTIQRIYRKLLFYRKVKRIQAAYIQYLKDRRTYAMKVLSRSFSVLLAKCTRWEVTQKIIVEQKLEIIRENLAKLTIKKYWRNLIVSVYDFLIKIRRYRRKLRYYSHLKTKVFAPGELHINKQDDNHTPEDVSEESFSSKDDIQRKVFGEKMQKMIKFGYISYNIRQLKVKDISPIFGDDSLHFKKELLNIRRFEPSSTRLKLEYPVTAQVAIRQKWTFSNNTLL